MKIGMPSRAEAQKRSGSGKGAFPRPYPERLGAPDESESPPEAAGRQPRFSLPEFLIRTRGDTLGMGRCVATCVDSVSLTSGVHTPNTFRVRYTLIVFLLSRCYRHLDVD